MWLAFISCPTGENNLKTKKTLGDTIGAFKSITTLECIRSVNKLGWATLNGKLRQLNYWEHIIRDEASYQKIANYAIINASNWAVD